MAGVEGKEAGGTIRRYGARVIVIHWLFIITFIPLLVSGLVLLRDWFAHEFHIYGIDYLVSPIDDLETWHSWFGLAVLVIGLVHILLHIGQKEKPIVPKNVGEDLAANIHNILYIFHLAPVAERGAGDKWKRNQRMTYVALVYCTSLSAITALFIYTELLGELGTVMHVGAGILMVFLAGYRILSLIRAHDGVSLKSILATGTMPEWYVKKNHFLWYRKLKGGYKAPPDPEYEKYSTEVVAKEEVVKV